MSRDVADGDEPLSPKSRASEVSRSSKRSRSSSFGSWSSGSRGSWFSKQLAVEDYGLDAFPPNPEGMEEIPDLPIPDKDQLTLCMVSIPGVETTHSHLRSGIVRTRRNDAEMTMMPWESSPPGSAFKQSGRVDKGVSFKEDARRIWPDGRCGTFAEMSEDLASENLDANALKRIWQELDEAPMWYGAPNIDNIDTAIWHDPGYSFAGRFQRQVVKAASEAAQQPGFTTKPKISESQKKDVLFGLKSMVVDLPCDTIEQELRPHMVQFWQDTQYSEMQQFDRKYPSFHPASKQSLEEKEELIRCANKRNTKRLLRPMLKPKPQPIPSTPVGQGREGDSNGFGPLNFTAMMEASGGSERFGAFAVPVVADHMLGLQHPETFGAMDEEARVQTFGGPQQQALYGWSTPAGPRYVPPAQKEAETACIAEEMRGIAAQVAKKEDTSKRWQMVRNELSEEDKAKLANLSPKSGTTSPKSFMSPKG